MKRRTPSLHTPPPTSNRGLSLRATLAQRIGVELPWNFPDSKGVVHQLRTDRETMCGLMLMFTDDKNLTLAQVTCLWCIADKPLEGWRYGP